MGLTLEAWFLLLIPVGIAFGAGGCAPMLIGHEFNIISGLIWAFVIFVVDMMIIKTESNPFVTFFRLILVFLSIVITATVVDLVFYKKDIEKKRIELNDSRYNSALSTWNSQLDIHNARMEKEEETGRGEDWKALNNQRINILNDKPQRSSVEGGILDNITLLHKIITEDNWAMALFFGWMGLVAILEALPVLLKNTKLKRQYR